MNEIQKELYSLEAEQGVLGAIMLFGVQSQEAEVDEVLSSVQVEDFYFEDNAALMQTILECHGAGTPVDAVTLGITRQLLPSGAHTLSYAADLTKNVPSAANWRAYADTLRERAVLRRVVQAGQMVTELARQQKPLADVIAGAQQAMADLRDLGGIEPDVVRFDEVMSEVIDGIDEQFNGRGSPRQSTGLSDLDDLLEGGLVRKTMFVVAGRPGSGKTILGLQIAQHITTRCEGVGVVFSMEMTRQELVRRGLASVGGVELRRLSMGNLMQDEDWPKLTAAVSVFQGKPLYLCDKPGMTVARIRSNARQLQRKQGLNVIVIDYIGLMKGEGATRTDRIASISTDLKNLAKELDVPVIVLAQLNRESTKRPGSKPRASDLRDSGQIEQDADVVLLVHRDMETEEGQNGITELIADKARQARVGSCFVQQQGQYARFTNFAGMREVSQEEVEMGRSSFKGRYEGRRASA